MSRILYINSIADGDITRYALCNYLSYYFSANRDEMFAELKMYDVELHIAMIFNKIKKESVYNSIESEMILAREEALRTIRLMIKHEIKFRFIDSYAVREELRELDTISPPLYEKIVGKLIEE